MSSFLYYLPKLQTVDLEAVRARVGHAIDRPGFASCRCAEGPDKGRGLLVGYFADDEIRLRYVPAEQTWRKIPGAEAWVGHYPGNRPGPEDLLRPDPLPGHPLTLGDGREWLIPVAFAWRGDEDAIAWQLQLPTRVDLDDEGQWTSGEVIPRYQTLYRETQRWFDYVTGGISRAAEAAEDSDETVRIKLDDQEFFDTALTVLGANYRVGRVEVVQLGLFDGRVCGELLNTAVELQTVLDWVRQKKTAPGSAPTDAGPAA